MSLLYGSGTIVQCIRDDTELHERKMMLRKTRQEVTQTQTLN